MLIFFFFNDTATTEIYTLSLHDALPIFLLCDKLLVSTNPGRRVAHFLECAKWHSPRASHWRRYGFARSEEHTSELQSRQYLVCRLLLEKKKKNNQDALPLVCYCIVHNLV